MVIGNGTEAMANLNAQGTGKAANQRENGQHIKTVSLTRLRISGLASEH